MHLIIIIMNWVLFIFLNNFRYSSDLLAIFFFRQLTDTILWVYIWICNNLFQRSKKCKQYIPSRTIDRWSTEICYYIRENWRSWRKFCHRTFNATFWRETDNPFTQFSIDCKRNELKYCEKVFSHHVMFMSFVLG